MAAYRQIKVSFWTDSFVLELNPQERGFFLYLLTNPSTTQCGIYELSLKMVVMQYGYTEELIKSMIQKFVDWGKICYNSLTHEFLILNWLKHNQSDNPSVVRCIEKELALVRTPEFLLYRKRCLLRADTTPAPRACGVDTTTTPLSKLIEDKNKLIINEEKEILKEENPSPELFQNSNPEEGEPLLLPHELIIQHLNLQAHTTYKTDSEPTRLLIENKIAQGFRVMDFFTVIDKKAKEWMNTEFESNLTPHILFTDKFEAYLEQNIIEKKRHKSSNRLDPAEFKNVEFVEVNE